MLTVSCPAAALYTTCYHNILSRSEISELTGAPGPLASSLSPCSSQLTHTHTRRRS